MTLHHSEETHQLLVDRGPAATGRAMKDWFVVVEDGPSFTRFEDRVNWLRDEHDLPHGYATAIIHEMDKTPKPCLKALIWQCTLPSDRGAITSSSLKNR